MTDHATDPPRDETALAILDLASAIREQTRALGVMARDSAIGVRAARQSVDASKQAVVAANEARQIAKDVKDHLESLRGGTSLELETLKERVEVLEKRRGDNGHG